MTQITADRAQQSTLQVNVLAVQEDQNNASDHLYGVGSKQCRVYAASSIAGPLIQVQSSWANGENYTNTALIENLVIDGQDQVETGILLKNVYNCCIRNVTIKNCQKGIVLHNYDGLWTEANLLKHIRMENVTQGILFSTDGPSGNNPGDSAGFTVIDDVGIQLANNSSAVGIQIGDVDYDTNPDAAHIKPYSSFIRANVWEQAAGSTGLKVMNGELKYGLINLVVQGPTGGIGIDTRPTNPNNNSRCIYSNQFSTFTTDQYTDPVNRGFLLACGGLNQTNWIKQRQNQTETNHDIRAIEY